MQRACSSTLLACDVLGNVHRFPVPINGNLYALVPLAHSVHVLVMFLQVGLGSASEMQHNKRDGSLAGASCSVTSSDRFLCKGLAARP